MSEFKNFVSNIIWFVVLCSICFFGGYLFCDRQATKRIEQANQQLAEQQHKYDELIKESETRIRESENRVREANERISEIREQLFGKISDNGSAITELTTIVEQIKKQRITL